MQHNEVAGVLFPDKRMIRESPKNQIGLYQTKAMMHRWPHLTEVGVVRSR